jgi:DNA-binding LytR/AlgR family response regulator
MTLISADQKKNMVKHNGSYFPVEIKEISYIEAREDYILIHTPQKRYIHHETTTKAAHNLKDAGFSRVHRSYIVNRSKIKSVRAQVAKVELGDKVATIPLGRSYRKEFKQKLFQETGIL